MREVDCLESGRRYDDELALLRGELTHTPPPPAPTPGLLPAAGFDHYGRLVLRVGTANLLAGRVKDALGEYEGVLKDYPKTALSAEAQYRMGFAYETGGDDFARALEEYGKVKEQFGQTPFTQQAQQRADNLLRIQQYRTGTGADSLEKKAEATFLTAELYLFQLNKPDRALEEYAKLSSRYAGTAVAGRALNAQAWVLSRKLDRKREADSLFWEVVRHYPATEAQLAARDYLEESGAEVPAELIKAPLPPPPPPVDTTKAQPVQGPALAPPPANVPALGSGAFAPADSLRRRGLMPGDELGPGLGRPGDPRRPGLFPPGMPVDSLGRPIPMPRVPPPFPPADSTRDRGER
jgi:tetratricopeptide (TPR) repeat protein